MKTYVFNVEMEQDEDGRWGAGIPALPGCATWGYTAEEALEALQEAAQAYLEDMVGGGRFQPGWKVARGRHSGSHSHTVTDSTRVAFLLRNTPVREINAGAGERRLRPSEVHEDGIPHLPAFRWPQSGHTLPPGRDTLVRKTLREILRGVQWTEGDLRRLDLIRN